MAMDFFGHQDIARKNTFRLAMYFVIVVVLISLAIYFATVIVILALEDSFEFSQKMRESIGLSDRDLWSRDVFVCSTVTTVALILISSLAQTFSIGSRGSFVAAMLGGRKLTPDTDHPQERKILNVVEEMALASGNPVPDVYMLDYEGGINAFAAGARPGDAVIGVTQGCVHHLSRDELQGVVAHEFSHILNGDMRLNLRMIGLLHGIMVIAVLGLDLLRTTLLFDDFDQRRTYTPTSEWHGRDRRPGGHFLIILAGMLLVVIGYIGVFFANLIKSAICREREFLADASAVQFTRNPEGIAGALKKIGGLSFGSRVVAPKAIEVSHMFFGNARRPNGWFTTHPPLIERIVRIDPDFDGSFPEMTPIGGPVVELETAKLMGNRQAQPQVSTQQLVGPAVLAASMAPAPHSTVAAEESVEKICTPTADHLEYAAELKDAIPPAMIDAAREPLGSQAVLYALLLDSNDAIRSTQIQRINDHGAPGTAEELQKLLPELESLRPECRLPLMELAIPALRDMSNEQYVAFKNNVYELATADHEINAFEYAVHRMMLHHLETSFEKPVPPTVRHHSVGDVLREIGQVFSILAHHGNPGDLAAAERAFRDGAARLKDEGTWIQILSVDNSRIAFLDGAIDILNHATPAIKRLVLVAAVACVSTDGRVSIEEGELIRAIADGLECPMPPLLPGQRLENNSDGD